MQELLWQLAGLICFSTAALLGAGYGGYQLRVWEERRRQRTLFVSPVISGWRPTGRVNALSTAVIMAASNEDTPAPFHLLVEERRLVEDVSGAALTELRWRYANRGEVKDLIRRHHQRLHDEPHLIEAKKNESSSG